MTWSELERQAIKAYGEECARAARIDALEEAREVVSAEELTEPEDNADDAYNCGVLDCVRAVEKLKGTP